MSAQRRRYEDLALRVPPEPVRRICTRCGDELGDREHGRCDDCIGRTRVTTGVWIAVLFWLAVAVIVVVGIRMLTALPATSEVVRPLASAGGGSSAASLVPGAPSRMTGSDGSGASTPSAGRSHPTTPLADGGAPLTGFAAWYDDGPGWYGAVPSWRYGDEPYAVQVCLAAAPATCTHVLVRDFCACGDRRGEPTVIDLSPSAFRELAPLSAGVVRVIVSGPMAVPLPPTDGAP